MSQSTSDTNDLWPDDIGFSDVIPPATILRQQAALLSRKTKGLVVAEVNTVSDGDSFRHNFFLTAPALDNYRYSLIRVVHGIQLYPVHLQTGEFAVEVKDESHLISALEKIFSSNETRRVLSSLIAQSRE